MQTVAHEFWQTLGGVFSLRPEAFYDALALPYAAYLAAGVVLLAALSEAVAQSVVLFANRVRPARFIFSLSVEGLLQVFGYGFLLLSTWLIMLLPGRSHLPLGILAFVFALSYAPHLFSFLGALPYCGLAIKWSLRVWNLLAMVVGVSAFARDNPLQELTDVGLGWLVLAIGQQTFGKPVARFGEWCLSAVAGVQIAGSEQLVVDRLRPELGRVDQGGGTAQATSGPLAPSAHVAHSNAWKFWLGAASVVALTIVVALALTPVQHSLLGWQQHLPRAARIPFDVAWVAFVGTIVAGFMAPVETLGWWAGWYGDRLHVLDPQAIQAEGGTAAQVSRYVVYLDGISQSSSRYTPDVETFLDALAPRLPADMRLVRGIMTYSVVNRPLDDDPIWAGFWRFVDALRLKNPQSLLGLIINLRNVLVVGVSADQRYGPLYNFGIAQLVCDALLHAGYAPRSGTPVTLIGYSGGGQMSAASAAFLHRALEAPIDVISLGGVISGTCRLLELEHLYHFRGTKDGVQRLGPIMFPSRWKLAPLSYWNRGLRLGKISLHSLGPVGHQVPGGMLDPVPKLPDGRTFLEQTLDCIATVLAGNMVTGPSPVPETPSNYAAYARAAWNRLETYPPDAIPDPEHYRPVGDWMGRLILPERERRAWAWGALFEVHHAPENQSALVGKTVRLQWSDDAQVRAAVRASAHDVHFGARAIESSRFGGLVQPVRLDDRQLVGPLESLAGSHPEDDLLVMLAGPVDVEPGDTPILRVQRQPVQIAARWYGLVRLLGPVDADGNAEVAHFSLESRAFDGPRERLRFPAPVADLSGLPPSTTRGLDSSPLNDSGWYAYGMLDSGGTFVVRALAPRALLGLRPDRSLPRAAAKDYLRKELWPALVARKGGTLSVRLADEQWKLGDHALLVHVYGGVGGERAEPSAKGPFYFGHFAFGFARVVQDPLAAESRFEIVYHQVYTHNGDGLIAGALHWSRYLGDRQFGWLGVRPTCDVLLKLDAVAPLLPMLRAQLEAMTARYRTGDGTGGTYVGAANNCAQDSNRALFGALSALDVLPKRRKLREAGEPELTALARDLRSELQSFGAPRPDWAENRFDLGSTMEDEPFEQVSLALGSWRVILPRLASETIVRTFLAHGASAWVLGTAQLGDRPEIAPVVPMTLPV